MKQATFKVTSEFIITREDVMEYLESEGFFDDMSEEERDSYEPTWDDFFNCGKQMWEDDQCEYDLEMEED